MIKSIIIDDGSNLREMIAHLVTNLCPNAWIIAEAESVQTGFKVINHDILSIEVLTK